ncbi:MAG: hypothetical protein WCK89_19555 [bacterium]
MRTSGGVSVRKSIGFHGTRGAPSCMPRAFCVNWKPDCFPLPQDEAPHLCLGCVPLQHPSLWI